MDEYQLNAVKHKRHLVATNVALDDEVVGDLTERKLINDKILSDAKSEVSNFNQMVKYMDAVELCEGLGKNVFNRFCSFVATYHPWIEDELRVEVKALNGELVVDDYIRSEVHKLVWDEFGKILRLKDEEKKEISDLVTIRSQLYKDMWKRAIKEATDLLNELMRCNVDKVALQRLILAELSKFLYVHLSEEEKEVLLEKGDLDELKLSDQLIREVGKLTEIAEMSLKERKDVMVDKHNALGVIEINTMQTRLNEEVEKKLVPIEKELYNLEEQLRIRQERVKQQQLQDDLEAVEIRKQKELAQKDAVILELNQEFQAQVKYGHDLKKEMSILQRKLGQAKILQKKLKSRAAVMEVTRTLGFVDSRHKKKVDHITESKVEVPKHLKEEHASAKFPRIE